MVMAIVLGFPGLTSAQEVLFRDERPAMGTTFAVSLYAADASSAEAAFEVAFEEIERIEQLLSDYRSTSELSRVNRSASTEPVTVEPEFLSLLERIRQISIETGGAFDPAVGALVDAWGFRTGTPARPDHPVFVEALSSTGLSHMALGVSDRTVRFDRTGVRLDPGAFGKGYAADRVVRILSESGVTRAFVNAGSSTFRALGPPPGEPGWIVTVQSDTVRVAHAGLSISGQDRRRFSEGGAEYGHILDPRTGIPAPAGRLAAVFASDATEADAWSTALVVLGAERAAEAIRDRPGVSALVLPAPSDATPAFRRHWPPDPERSGSILP